MRWTTMTITLMMLTALSSSALAQEQGREAMKDHDGMKGHGHMEMRVSMMPAMPGALAGHAESLDLSGDQVERLEALDERLEAEKERHHAEMRSIHETAMEVLTPEQRERAHELMRSMHAERGGMKGHGMKTHGKTTDDDEAEHDDHEG